MMREILANYNSVIFEILEFGEIRSSIAKREMSEPMPENKEKKSIIKVNDEEEDAGGLTGDETPAGATA